MKRTQNSGKSKETQCFCVSCYCFSASVQQNCLQCSMFACVSSFDSDFSLNFLFCFCVLSSEFCKWVKMLCFFHFSLKNVLNFVSISLIAKKGRNFLFECSTIVFSLFVSFFYISILQILWVLNVMRLVYCIVCEFIMKFVQDEMKSLYWFKCFN